MLPPTTGDQVHLLTNKTTVEPRYCRPTVGLLRRGALRPAGRLDICIFKLASQTSDATAGVHSLPP